MNNKEIFKEIGHIDEHLVEEASVAKGRKKPTFKKWGLVAAGFVFVTGIGGVVYNSAMNAPQSALQSPPQITQQQLPVSAPTPEGYRKIFYYNGYTYALVEGEELYQLNDFEPTKPLGTLQFDIMQGEKEDGTNKYAETEFATNYAVGGKLYEIPAYPSKFRVAVEYEGIYYLAEIVSKVNNSEVSAKEYLDFASLKEHTQEVSIFNHMGDQSLYKFTDHTTTQSIIEELYTAKAVNLTDKEYEAIGGAQSEGKSYQLKFMMKDGTDVSMYIIPELKSISMGDNMYQLSDSFLAKYGPIFTELKQAPLPQF